MTIEVEVRKTKYHGENTPHMNIHDTEHLSQRAAICIEMISRWGMVAAIDDGEDSSGRAKLKLQNHKDIVDRAVSMTDYAYNCFAQQGWIVNMPTMKEADEIIKAKKLERDELHDSIKKAHDLIDNALERTED